MLPTPRRRAPHRAGGVGAALRLGIDRIGDLAAMPRAPLERRFGRTLLLRFDQALGRAGETFEPVVPEEPPNVLLRFLEPIATAEAIGEALRHRCAFDRDLTEAGRAARRLDRLRGRRRRADYRDRHRPCDPRLRSSASLLRAKIETIEPGFGIEAMRLVADALEPLGPRPITSALRRGRRPISSR